MDCELWVAGEETEGEGEVVTPAAVDESFHAVDEDEEDVRDLHMVRTSNGSAPPIRLYMLECTSIV